MTEISDRQITFWFITTLVLITLMSIFITIIIYETYIHSPSCTPNPAYYPPILDNIVYCQP